MQNEDVEFCDRNIKITMKEAWMETYVHKRSTRARLTRMAGIGEEDKKSQPTAPRTLVPAVKLRTVVFTTSHRPALQ